MFSIFLDACSIETRGERYWGGLSPLEGYLDPPPRALNLNLFPFPFPSFNVDPRLAVLLQQNKSGVNCDVNSCRNSGSTRATSVSVIGRRPGPIDIDCLKAFTRRSANKIMCRLSDAGIDKCLLCPFTAHRKCPHEIAVCTNQAVHPLWKAYYYKNAGDISTFQGCGFCKYAARMGLRTPATQLPDNRGWPGCCFPPDLKHYSWIPMKDWSLVAAYHSMDIPEAVKTASSNPSHTRTRSRGGSGGTNPPAGKLSIEITRSIQQPVPIPHYTKAGSPPSSSSGHNTNHRSYSPSAIYLPTSERSPPRSISSRESNSSGSPPSSTVARSRRDYHDFEGSERSSNSPSSPARSPSQDGHYVGGSRPSSSLQTRRGESPIDRGKRRSNSDPKNQSGTTMSMNITTSTTTAPSAYHARDMSPPQQPRLKPSPPASVVSSNHPYANPYSTASSSMSRLGGGAGSGNGGGGGSSAKSTVSSNYSSQAYRAPAAPPRVRETSGPSITSVLANMSLSYTSPMPPPSSSARSRIAPSAAPVMPLKRGVIPPHVVRGGGSVISGTSSSSSSTNSSAQEGTVVSDSFTDYLSDDSDFDLQRRAEEEAENAFVEALERHEANEFSQARASLAHAPAPGRTRMPNMPAPPRSVRV